jgi:hypothetical protein
VENRRVGEDLHSMQVGGLEDAYLSPGPEPEYFVIAERLWYRYIYEPAIIVHLGCHIGHRGLGIILSKSSIGTHGNFLWRLHNPSIVAIQAFPGSPLPSPTTVYANISNRINDMPFVGYLWPEIRIASLLAAGYDVHQDCGPGWELHRPRSALVQKKTLVYGRDWTRRAPIARFYRVSDEEKTSPGRAFYVSLPECDMDSGRAFNLKCEVGVHKTAPLHESPFKHWNYDLHSFDLAKIRRLEVSLGNGQALVVKLREGSRIRFVNVSIESLNKAKAT